MDAADIFLIALKSIDIFTVHCNAYFFLRGGPSYMRSMIIRYR